MRFSVTTSFSKICSILATCDVSIKGLSSVSHSTSIKKCYKYFYNNLKFRILLPSNNPSSDSSLASTSFCMSPICNRRFNRQSVASIGFSGNGMLGTGKD